LGSLLGSPVRVSKPLCLILLCAVPLFSFALDAGNLVLIDGGKFIMGSPAGETGREGNERQREVTVSSFFMGKFELSQAEYEKLMGKNPSFFKGANLPVEQISWFEAVEFCNALSVKEGFAPAYTISGSASKQTVQWDHAANGYRLPTEAEWEYACRAGTTTPFNTGDNLTSEQANYDANRPYKNFPEGTSRQETMPVGSFLPNPLGLYDMHGNVGEWCWDWNSVYHVEPDLFNPTGAASGLYRVFRGGAWNLSANFTRTARRGGANPVSRWAHIGIRLVRNVEEDSGQLEVGDGEETEDSEEAPQ